MPRYIRISLPSGLFGDKDQTTSTYFTYLIVDLGLDRTGRDAIAHCASSTRADEILAALNV